MKSGYYGISRNQHGEEGNFWAQSGFMIWIGAMMMEGRMVIEVEWERRDRRWRD